jgi:acyl-CoA dehydrogenase
VKDNQSLHESLRRNVRELCARFPDTYWRDLETRREYPEEFVRTLTGAGYLASLIPEQYGGAGLGITEAALILEEINRSGANGAACHAQMYIVATLLRHGSEDQKQRYLPSIASGDLRLQAFGVTEPTTGSDTTQVKTKAVRTGDHFVVNGQKVWTSGAHHADWCLCFVRTDPEAPKHKGISALLIDMKTAGVECRPFPELSEPDYFDFNEVFFTDAVVPAENLLGELNHGWPITQGSLAHERAMLWIDYAYDAQRCVQSLIALGARPGPNGAPLREDALMLLGYRGFSKFMRGRSSSEHSLLKLYGSETIQRCLAAGVEAQGADALDTTVYGPSMWREGAWAVQWLRSFSGTIPGGTSEIQRNIIAERVLGLPRR